MAKAEKDSGQLVVMIQMVVIMQLSLLKGYMDAPIAMQGTWWNFLTHQLIPEVQA